MNMDTVKEKVKDWPGQLKSWWSNITDDDLRKIEGDRQQLIGVLQQRYGWSKTRIKKEIYKHINETQKEQEKNSRPARKIRGKV